MRAPLGLLAALVVAACGRHDDPVAAAIRRDLTRELGQPVRRVTCHGAACEAITAAGLHIAIALSQTRPVTWETADLIDPRPIADAVQAALADVGAAQAVDCGALRLAEPGGDHVECALAGGGAAFVTVAADDAIDVELALTAAIAAARREVADPAELERASRALDTDEAEGLDDDSDDDAGVDGDPGGEIDAGLPTSGG